MMLVQSGKWKGPTVLLAQAFVLYHQPSDISFNVLVLQAFDVDNIWIPDNVVVFIVHGSKDDVVPYQQSVTLSKQGTILLTHCLTMPAPSLLTFGERNAFSIATFPIHWS